MRPSKTVIKTKTLIEIDFFWPVTEKNMPRLKKTTYFVACRNLSSMTNCVCSKVNAVVDGECHAEVRDTITNTQKTTEQMREEYKMK